VARKGAAVEVQPQHSGVRVVVADDVVLLREGLARLLAGSGYCVVGQAGEALGFLELVRVEKPELVIVDIGCRRPAPPRDSIPR
jgi:DNA-binding NarL/FixJ family response regulator